MSAQPWMKFYPADWRSEPTLRAVSIAARGMWMEVLCLMWQAEPQGSLLLKDKPIPMKILAGLCGVPVKDCEALVAELEEVGVFSRDDDGTIYSRRMRKDVAKAARDKANGKTGGNPDLIKGVNPPDNPGGGGQDKPSDKRGDKAQKPEARSQSLEAAAQLSAARAKRLEPHDDGPAEFAAAMRSCADAIGDSPPTEPTFGPIMLLVQRGIPIGEILTVLRSEAESRRIRGKPPIKFWSKWAEIVVERLDAALKVAVPKTDPDDPRIEFPGGVRWPRSGVIDAVRQWRADPRSWPPVLGFPPDHPSCCVPRNLVGEVSDAA